MTATSTWSPQHFAKTTAAPRPQVREGEIVFGPSAEESVSKVSKGTIGQWDFMGFHGDFMGISWGFHGDFMGFHGTSWDFMGISWGFHGDFMGFHGDFMGFHGDFMEISPTIMVVQWEWGFHGI